MTQRQARVTTRGRQRQRPRKFHTNPFVFVALAVLYPKCAVHIPSVHGFCLHSQRPWFIWHEGVQQTGPTIGFSTTTITTTSSSCLQYTILGGIPEEEDDDDDNDNDQRKNNDNHYEEYIAPLQLTLQLLTQSRESDGSVSMAGTPWTASSLLAHIIALSPSSLSLSQGTRTSEPSQAVRNGLLDFHQKTVVELGSGVGTCAIVAALMGASYVVATDASSTSLRLIRSNAEAYASRMPRGQNVIEAAPLLWGDRDSLAILLEEVPSIDIIMASDVVYHQSAREGLRDTVETICTTSTRPPTVLLAHTWRTDPEGEAAFFEELLSSTTTTTCTASSGSTTYRYQRQELDPSFFPPEYSRRGPNGQLPVVVYVYTPVSVSA